MPSSTTRWQTRPHESCRSSLILNQGDAPTYIPRNHLSISRCSIMNDLARLGSSPRWSSGEGAGNQRNRVWMMGDNTVNPSIHDRSEGSIRLEFDDILENRMERRAQNHTQGINSPRTVSSKDRPHRAARLHNTDNAASEFKSLPICVMVFCSGSWSHRIWWRTGASDARFPTWPYLKELEARKEKRGDRWLSEPHRSCES